MSFLKSVNKLIIGLLAVTAISYGLKLYAQQSAGLTPPPKPPEPNSANNNNPSIPSGPAFSVGERLSYNISWTNFSTAARLSMEVSERGKFYGQDGYQIKTKIETVGKVRSLFGEVDNQYITYVNLNNAVPYRLVNSIRQGATQIEETVVMDQARQQAIFSDDKTLSIASGTYDLPSLVYAQRLRPWPEKGKHKFTAVYGHEVVEIIAAVKTRERITTQSGTYNTVCVKYYPQKKRSSYRVTAWFSDDKQRLPVLISARLSFGDVRAELASVSQLSRPSSALAELRNSTTDESGRLSIISRNPGTFGSGTPSELKTSTDEAGGPSSGRNGGDDPALPFTVGERLSFDISWGNFVSVGKANFEVRQQGMLGNNRVFVFYGEATTTGAVRTLIDVNDQVSSFALVDKLVPIRTDLSLREGKRSKQASITYNLTTNSASVSSGTDLAIRPGTYDLVSLLYAIRASELKIGSTSIFSFLDANARLQMIMVKVMKQESIGGPMGTRNTLQLNILTPTPKPVVIAQAWISDDSRRLPLYIATRTKFGELRFQMTGATNSK